MNFEVESRDCYGNKGKLVGTPFSFEENPIDPLYRLFTLEFADGKREVFRQKDMTPTDKPLTASVAHGNRKGNNPTEVVCVQCGASWFVQRVQRDTPHLCVKCRQPRKVRVFPPLIATPGMIEMAKTMTITEIARELELNPEVVTRRLKTSGVSAIKKPAKRVMRYLGTK